MPTDRNRLLALIHIGKAELGLPEDVYRDMIEARSRIKARTAARLSMYEMSLVLDDMKARGFALPGRGSRTNPRPAAHRHQPHPANQTKEAGTIGAARRDRFSRPIGKNDPHPESKLCWPCAPRKPREKLPSTVILSVSKEQLHRIEHLRKEIRWKVWNGFSLWLKKYHGIDTIAGITTSLQASAIIQGLTGMWKWQNGCKCRKAAGSKAHGA